MVDLTVRVYADEVVAVLNSKRQRLRKVLDSKMAEIVDEAKHSFLQGLPGKYIDPKTIESGVTGLGSMTVIGFLESHDKGGYYSILPTKARALRFISKSGDLVFAKQVLRLYLSTGKFMEPHLLDLKPWIESQLEDAINEV